MARVYKGKGYYPTPWSVSANPNRSWNHKQDAIASKAHRAGEAHHLSFCFRCQRAGESVCSLCLKACGREDGCLVKRADEMEAAAS